MADNEVDSHIEERPATHKADAQRWMIGGGIILACAFAVGLYFSIINEKNKVQPSQESHDLDENSNKEVMSAADRFELEFEQKRKRKEAEEQRERERLAALARQKNQHEEKIKYEEHIEQLMARQKPVFSAKKDPVAEWRSTEEIRALKSRSSQFSFDLDNKQTGNLVLSKAEQNRQAIIKRDIAGVPSIRDMINQKLGITPGEQPVAVAGQPAPSANGKITGFAKHNPYADEQSLEGKVLVPTGTVINAVLSQTVVSDYPKSFKGMVTHDVYDASYETILFPKGTEIIGKSVLISNVNEPIQSRMGLIVNWFVYPDGTRVDMSRTSALDQAGIGGIKDKVNHHYIAQFLGVAAYALLSSNTSRSGSGANSNSTFAGDTGRAAREQFAPLAAKYLDLVPTVTLRIGKPFKVFLEDDVYVKPWGTIYDQLLTKD